MRLSQMITVAFIISALGLAGCGVRGPLEPPPNAPPPEKDKPIVLDKLIR